jgi:hypothetical protein
MNPDPAALAARRRARIHNLRMRVAAGVLSAFLAIWCVLFVQLATGHDPAVDNGATAAIVQSADPEVTTDASDERALQAASDDAGALASHRP